LVRDCVWAVLEFFFCALKEKFYEEAKCGFLGFWFEKRENERMMELSEAK